MALNMEKWRERLATAKMFMSMLVAMTGNGWTKELFDFVVSIWESKDFQGFVKQTPAATEDQEGLATMPVMSLEAPTPEAQALFDKYKAAVGEEKAGNISEFLTLLFEFVAWFKAFQARRQPAAPAGS